MRVQKIIFLIAIWLITAVALLAQNISLSLSKPNSDEFPLVRLNLRAADANNVPLTDIDLTSLRLRENGVPISDFDARYVPVGLDIVFVLDADTTLQFADNQDGTRLDTVRELIGRYATRFMSPSGLDRISIAVPTDNNRAATFLLQDATTAEQVINALASYDPQNLAEEAPVAELFSTAVAHLAAQQTDGRYQAIFFLSEARRLNQLLDYDTAVAQAQAAAVPVFVAILGPEASLDDIGNASALATPTGGFYLHTPQPERADTLYLRWQQESNQPQISYRSLLRQSGNYPITVNLGQIAASTTLDLQIAPPQLSIALERSVIRRVGTAVDTPLDELQPTLQPIPVQIDWGDGRPRPLRNVQFRINNVLQPLLTLPQPDENGRFVLEWPIQNVGVGAYELSVTIEDELGYTATSDSLIVTVAVDRPPAPTPTPAPTATLSPVAQLAIRTSNLPQTQLLSLLAALALLGLVLLLIRFARHYRQQTAVHAARAKQHAALQQLRQREETAVDDDENGEPRHLRLSWLSPTGQQRQFVLDQGRLQIGRHQAADQLGLDDRSVFPLHGRISWRNGRYWLYDEGSSSGTFLNDVRLGLSPRPLADGDLIQMGRISLAVQLLLPQDLPQPLPPSDAETTDTAVEAPPSTPENDTE